MGADYNSLAVQHTGAAIVVDLRRLSKRYGSVDTRRQHSSVAPSHVSNYTVAHKKVPLLFFTITLANVDRFQ